MAEKEKITGKSVLFVCTGNTCRSPMAEGLFRKALAKRQGWTVRSAGVAASVGSKENRDTTKILAMLEANLSDFRSRQITRAMMEQADAVFAMTQGHIHAMEDEFPEFADKIYLIGDFSAEGGDVPDPIGMGAKAYEEVAVTLAACFPGIIQFLEAGGDEEEK